MFSRSDPFSKLQVMREVRGKVFRSESEEESSFINSFRDALVHRVIHFFQDFQSCKQVLLEKRMNQDFSIPGEEKEERNYSHSRWMCHEISKLVWWCIVKEYIEGWTWEYRYIFWSKLMIDETKRNRWYILWIHGYFVKILSKYNWDQFDDQSIS